MLGRLMSDGQESGVFVCTVGGKGGGGVCVSGVGGCHVTEWLRIVVINPSKKHQSACPK